MSNETGFPRLVEPAFVRDIEAGRAQLAYAYGAAVAFGLMGMAFAIQEREHAALGRGFDEAMDRGTRERAAVRRKRPGCF